MWSLFLHLPTPNFTWWRPASKPENYLPTQWLKKKDLLQITVWLYCYTWFVSVLIFCILLLLLIIFWLVSWCFHVWLLVLQYLLTICPAWSMPGSRQHKMVTQNTITNFAVYFLFKIFQSFIVYIAGRYIRHLLASCLREERRTVMVSLATGLLSNVTCRF
jgi:hypothetical protein